MNWTQAPSSQTSRTVKKVLDKARLTKVQIKAIQALGPGGYFDTVTNRKTIEALEEMRYVLSIPGEVLEPDPRKRCYKITAKGSALLKSISVAPLG